MLRRFGTVKRPFKNERFKGKKGQRTPIIIFGSPKKSFLFTPNPNLMGGVGGETLWRLPDVSFFGAKEFDAIFF